MGQPVFCSHSWATALCTAMPPPTETFRCDQSTVLKSGWLARPLNSVLTAGKMGERRMASCSKVALWLRGFGGTMVFSPLRMDSSMVHLLAEIFVAMRAAQLVGIS